jgi:hypothetical protein
MELPVFVITKNRYYLILKKAFTFWKRMRSLHDRLSQNELSKKSLTKPYMLTGLFSIWGEFKKSVRIISPRSRAFPRWASHLEYMVL